MMPVVPQELHEGGSVVVFGSGQPEYIPLVASRDPIGNVMTEWELTEEEREILSAGGRVRLWIVTGNAPLQPVTLEAVAVTSAKRLLT